MSADKHFEQDEGTGNFKKQEYDDFEEYEDQESIILTDFIAEQERAGVFDTPEGFFDDQTNGHQGGQDNAEYESQIENIKRYVQQYKGSEQITQEEMEEMMKYCLNGMKWWYQGFGHMHMNEGMDEQFMESNIAIVSQLQYFIEDMIQTQQKRHRGQVDVQSHEEFPQMAVQNIGKNQNLLQKMEEEKELEALRKNNYSLAFFNSGRGGGGGGGGGSNGNGGGSNAYGQRNQLQNLWMNANYNKLYSAHREGDGANIQQLCDMFEQVDPNVIRLVYFNLEGDFDKSLTFLKENHKSAYKSPLQKQQQFQQQRQKREQGEQKNLPPQPQLQKKKYSIEDFEQTKEYDEDLFQEIRSMIQRHLGMRYIFSRSASQCQKINEKNRFKQMASEQQGELENLENLSRRMYLYKIRQQKIQDKIDLHGFFLGESLKLCDLQIQYLKKLARQAPQRLNINKEGKIVYEIVTGRGRHSQNGQAILFPNILKLLKDLGVDAKGKKEEGKIFAYISV